MNDYCIESIPYASSIGFILLLFGCGVFSGTIWTGSDRFSRLFNDQFFKISEPSYLQKASLIYAIITLVIGIVILIYGISVTGTTRRKIYKSNRNTSASKAGSGLLLGCCYVLVAGWLCICVVGAATVTIWMMVSIICHNELKYWQDIETNKDAAPFVYSFNLSNYGVYPRSIIKNVKTSINTVENMQFFCQEMSTIGPLFSVGFICSIIVLISLLTLISALAANLVRLKYLPEIVKFHHIASSSYAGGDPGASSIGQAHLSMATHSTLDPPHPYLSNGGAAPSNSQYGHHYGPTQMEMQPLNPQPQPISSSTSQPYYMSSASNNYLINNNNRYSQSNMNNQYQPHSSIVPINSNNHNPNTSLV